MQPGVRGEQGLGLPNRWATGKALHEAGVFFKSIHSPPPNTTAKRLPFHLCGDTISNLTEFWQKQLAYELVINYLRQQGIEGANLHISRRNSGTKGFFNLPICSFLSGPPLPHALGTLSTTRWGRGKSSLSTFPLCLLKHTALLTEP